MKLLCIVSSPRSGTNHFCELIGSFGNFRSQKEVFHKEGCFTLNDAEVAAVSAEANLAFSSFRDPALTSFVRENPVKFLNALIAANSGREVISFKIFPNQLRLRKIKEILDAFPELSLIILRRGLLDTYISFLKALEIGTWTDAHTSGVKISLNADHYLRWAGDISAWYLLWESLIAKRNLRHVNFTYESVIAPGNAEVFRRLHEASSPLGLPFPVPAAEKAGLMKQDRTTDYAKKVENWAQFVEQMRQLGLMPPLA